MENSHQPEITTTVNSYKLTAASTPFSICLRAYSEKESRLFELHLLDSALPHDVQAMCDNCALLFGLLKEAFQNGVNFIEDGRLLISFTAAIGRKEIHRELVLQLHQIPIDEVQKLRMKLYRIEEKQSAIRARLEDNAAMIRSLQSSAVFDPGERVRLKLNREAKNFKPLEYNAGRLTVTDPLDSPISLCLSPVGLVGVSYFEVGTLMAGNRKFEVGLISNYSRLHDSEHRSNSVVLGLATSEVYVRGTKSVETSFKLQEGNRLRVVVDVASRRVTWECVYPNLERIAEVILPEGQWHPHVAFYQDFCGSIVLL